MEEELDEYLQAWEGATTDDDIVWEEEIVAEDTQGEYQEEQNDGEETEKGTQSPTGAKPTIPPKHKSGCPKEYTPDPRTEWVADAIQRNELEAIGEIANAGFAATVEELEQFAKDVPLHIDVAKIRKMRKKLDSLLLRLSDASALSVEDSASRGTLLRLASTEVFLSRRHWCFRCGPREAWLYNHLDKLCARCVKYRVICPKCASCGCSRGYASQ